MSRFVILSGTVHVAEHFTTWTVPGRMTNKTCSATKSLREQEHPYSANISPYRRLNTEGFTPVLCLNNLLK